MDKRASFRVDYRAIAEVSGPDGVVSGEVSNLSLKGMYFLTNREVALETPVEVRMRLADAETEVHLDLQGMVVRTDGDGWGILFTSMGLEAFGHLRNVVIYNSGRDEQIMEEFRHLLAAGLDC